MHHARTSVHDRTRRTVGAPRYWGRWLDRLGSLLDRTVHAMEGRFSEGQWWNLARSAEGCDNFGYDTFAHPELILQGVLAHLVKTNEDRHAGDTTRKVEALTPFEAWALLDTLSLFWEYYRTYGETPRAAEWWTLSWRHKLVASLRG